MSDQPLNARPFCGNTDQKISVNQNLGYMSFVCCDGCGSVVSFRGHHSVPATIEQYNRRAKAH